MFLQLEYERKDDMFSDFNERELESIINASKRIIKRISGTRFTIKQLESELCNPLMSSFVLEYKLQNVYSDYFSYSYNKFSLTTKGLQYHYTNHESSAVSSKSNKISNLIRNYADKLKKTYLEISSIMSVDIMLHNSDQTKKYIYLIELKETAEIENPISEDMWVQIKLTYMNERISIAKGVIVGQENDELLSYYFATEEKIEGEFIKASMEVVNNYLYKQLATRIEAIGSNNTFYELLKSGKPCPQDEMIFSSDTIASILLKDLDNIWSKLIWGPPGTGKTYAIADFINKVLETDPCYTILVVAPTNHAVDNVLLNVTNQVKKGSMTEQLINERKFLRYGFTKDSRLLENEKVQGPVDFDKNINWVRKRSDRLKAAILNGTPKDEIARLKSDLLEAQINHKQDIHQHAVTAQVVFTTTTQTFLETSPLNDRKWDIVIIDEASMVPAAYCYYIASTTNKHLLIVGDPNQLNPVFNLVEIEQIEKTLEWLGNDIFSKTGIYHSNEFQLLPRIEPRSNLLQINSQYRCIPSIWENVKGLYPTMNFLSGNHNDIVSMPPFSDKNTVIIDTSQIDDGFTNHSQYKRSGSRYNLYSAGLTMRIAISCVENNKEEFLNSASDLRISIITPYRAQVKELKSILPEFDGILNRDNENTSGGYQSRRLSQALKIGTIHQFQGDESHIVIVDLVESNRDKKIGKILSGEMGQKLINVASTRAKCKIFFVMNTKHFLQLNVRSVNPLLYSIIKSENAHVIEIADDPSNAEDRLADTIWEKAFRDEFLRQHRDWLKKGREFPMFTQQYNIFDESNRFITRPDFAFPDQKRAIFIDGKSIHLFNVAKYIRDREKRSKIKELGWKSEEYLNEVITNNCREKVMELFKLLKPIRLFDPSQEPSEFNLVQKPQVNNQKKLF